MTATVRVSLTYTCDKFLTAGVDVDGIVDSDDVITVVSISMSSTPASLDAWFCGELASFSVRLTDVIPEFKNRVTCT